MSGSYTAEQEKVVLHVFKFKAHQYYEILECRKSSTEGEIKKSYRKLAIKLHPDKNPHPRSAEAFKIVNKAWEVLSDKSKKMIFDQTGADPDSRFAQASSGAGTPFRNGASLFQGFQSAGGGRVFEDDIFNMFFGGGGQPQTFSFGGTNGFSFQSFGGGDPSAQRRAQARQQTRRPAAQGDPSTSESIKQLAPILLMLFFVIISALFSDSDSVPNYSFQKSRSFPIAKKTSNYKIPFFVEKSFLENELTANQLKKFSNKVENTYVEDKRTRCSRERSMRNQLLDEAQGWFSIDQEKVRRAEKLPMPNCQALRDLNLL